MSTKLAIIEIDGTLYRWQLVHEIVFTLKRRGVFTDEAAKSLDDAYTGWLARALPYKSYESKVVHTLIDSLPDIPPRLFDEVAQEVANKSGRKTYVYTLRLIKQLKQRGYLLVALSGSQQEVAELFAGQYGFDDCIGSLYERKDGKFTGKLLRDVPGNKDVIIKEYAAKHGYSLKDSVAVGDSGSDVSILKLVDNPIAFNPDSNLYSIAILNGWKVVLERKNMIYTLQPGPNGQYVLTYADQH